MADKKNSSKSKPNLSEEEKNALKNIRKVVYNPPKGSKKRDLSTEDQDDTVSRPDNKKRKKEDVRKQKMEIDDLENEELDLWRDLAAKISGQDVTILIDESDSTIMQFDTMMVENYFKSINPGFKLQWIPMDVGEDTGKELLKKLKPDSMFVSLMRRQKIEEFATANGLEKRFFELRQLHPITERNEGLKEFSITKAALFQKTFSFP